MKTAVQIEKLISSQAEPKRSDMQTLHELMLRIAPGIRLWFDDGKDSNNKTVTNPAIGYGFQVLRYANGKTKDFFQIGISANATGISIYILGLDDKKYLADTYGEKIGKAKITSYLIRFKTLADLNMDVLEAALRYGLEATKPA